MQKTWTVFSFWLVSLMFTTHIAASPECTPRQELRDQHVLTYQAYNGTLRGCIVKPDFYTQQHKQGRGKLTRRFIITICEDEPRTSPRVGDSFEICPYVSPHQSKDTSKN